MQQYAKLLQSTLDLEQEDKGLISQQDKACKKVVKPQQTNDFGITL